MDFNNIIYKELLNVLLNHSYYFQTFNEFIPTLKKDKLNNQQIIILRHDVDLLPENSLLFAKIQHELGIKGTYYFRAVPESWDEKIISEISSLGHEIGYHYESLTTCKGDIDKAYIDFCENLEKLRNLAPVSTICMHGSPESPYDSKDIWKKYSYKDLGIIGEPYFDTNFSKVFYITDTGRRWDGYKVSVRDKIPLHQDRWNSEGLTFHNTADIINAINTNRFPENVMFTFHPQRWHNNIFLWLRELILQRFKNIIKFFLIKLRY